MNCRCGTPIASHEVGRELDKCVAEALGWTSFEIYRSGAILSDIEEFKVLVGINPFKRGTKEEEVPRFSESWAAHGGLIGEFHKGGYRLSVTEYTDGWYVTFVESPEKFINTPHQVSQVETLQHAICLAFLVWKGGE